MSHPSSRLSIPGDRSVLPTAGGRRTAARASRSAALPPEEFTVIMDALRRERDAEMRLHALPDPVLLMASARLLHRQIGGLVSCALAEVAGHRSLPLTTDLAASIYTRFFAHGIPQPGVDPLAAFDAGLDGQTAGPEA